MLERISSPSRSRKLDRGDRALMWLLTAVYTIFTLVNLGTLRFPQTEWRGEPGASVTIDLGEEKEVAAFRYNGGIGLGEMTITADDGSVFDFSQVYGDMFSWRVSRLGFTTRYLLLECVSGEVVFNEIAFADPEGTVLKASVVGEEGTALLDEQDTLPQKPSYFNGMYFDEIYHARTAYEFLHTMSVYEWTHPPLGKELIALGVAVFGMKPFGWRVVPALFGAAMLPVLFILGKRLFRRRDCAFLASALFALDTMHFAQTRIATVDVFVVFFILLMYLFMTDYLYLDAENAPLRKAFLPLGACGIAFGLGTASKWTGLYAGAGLAVLFFANLFGDIARSGKGEESRRAWGRAWKTIAFCCVFFLLVPAAIYFLSYIPFYRYEAAADPGTPMTFRRMLDILVRQQESMYSYHSALTATHSSQSAWYEWPFGAMSVWFYCSSNESTVSNISTFVNPAVCWVCAVGTLCAVTELLFGKMKKDPDYRKTALTILLVAIAANYLPWTLVTRCTFQYHYFPTMPFVILCGVLLLQHLEESGEVSARVKWIWLAFSAVYFLLLLPACSGITVPKVFARFIEHFLPAGNLYHGVI